MKSVELKYNYRWEFLKRNKDYISGFMKLDGNASDYSDEEFDIELNAFLERWGINFLASPEETYPIHSKKNCLNNQIPFFTDNQRERLISSGTLSYSELPSFVKMNEIDTVNSMTKKFDIGDVDEKRFAFAVIDLGIEKKESKNTRKDPEFDDALAYFRNANKKYRNQLGRFQKSFESDELDLLIDIYDLREKDTITNGQILEIINGKWSEKYPEKFKSSERLNDETKVKPKYEQAKLLISNINYFPYSVTQSYLE